MASYTQVSPRSGPRGGSKTARPLIGGVRVRNPPPRGAEGVGGRWVEAVTGKVAFRAGRRGAEVGSKTGERVFPTGPNLPTRPRPPPPWRTFVSDGPSESPEVDAACFPRREAASRVDTQNGEEQAAQSGLSTGQGPSLGASEVPIDQAPPR
ncbi:hypothetical protein PO909_000948 [Leuciscus waleckii]